MRLVRDVNPGCTRRLSDARELGIYRYRDGAGREWNAVFACSDAVECLLADFDNAMATSMGAHAEGFQMFTVLVVQSLRRGKWGRVERKRFLGRGCWLMRW